MQMQIITATAKPFRTEPRGEYQFAVEADGTVRVWDSVAHHYTLRHSLSPRAASRIARMARATEPTEPSA